MKPDEDVSAFAAGTKLVILLVVFWSTASHLAWAGPEEGGMAEAGLPSRVVRGEELQDLMPLEPLWDILLPLASLGVGTSLGLFGMRLTLGLTFAWPLLLLLSPTLLSFLEDFHERLLSWHLGGIFGQPMLVAQVAVAHAERQAGSKCLKAFGVLVGGYSLGAALGGLIRRSMLLLPHAFSQVCLQLLILVLVGGNLLIIWYRGDILGEHSHGHLEETPLAPSHPEESRTKTLRRLRRFLLAELMRAADSLSGCSRHLVARAAVLLGLTCIMGPAPLPALDLLAFTPLRAGFAVFWFDLVGVVSYAILVPLLDHLGNPKTRLECLDGFFAVAGACCLAAAISAMLHFTSTLTVAMIAGLMLSCCCAVVSAVLTADMSEQAPHLADVGVRLAWGLLSGAAAQYAGVRLGQALFLKSSWLGVCSAASCCLLVSRVWSYKALGSAGHFRPAPPAPERM